MRAAALRILPAALRWAVVLPVLMVVAGCGIGAESRPQPLPAASAALPAPTASPSTPAARNVSVYLVDARGGLRRVTLGGRPGPYLSASVDTLLQVGTTLTAPDGTRNLVPRGTTLGRVVVDPSDVLVDLGPEFLGLRGPDQVLATAQLVYTATDQRPGAGVRLTVRGREVPVPVGDGSLRTGTVRRADYAGVVEVDASAG